MPSYLHFSITWDIVLFFCLSAILFFWGNARSKNKIKFVILGAYLSIVLFGVLPVREFEISFGIRTALFRIALLCGIIAILVFSLQKIFRESDARGSVWKTLILSLLTAGFLMNIFISHVPYTTMDFSPLVIKMFGPEDTAWLWNVAPLLGLMLL